MKNIISTLVLAVFMLNYCSGQIGVSGAYKTLSAEGWNKYTHTEFDDHSDPASGYAAALNYWFRLKNQRIEFLPEISYEKYEATSRTSSVEHRILGFYFNTNVYPFDFKGDCNCPTWSKSGNFFSKGFFIQVSPGVQYFNNRFTADVLYEDETFGWTIGAGAGIDLGVTEFLTITPIIKTYYSPGINWSNLPDLYSNPVSADSSIRQLYAGIKLGFRLRK